MAVRQLVARYCDAVARFDADLFAALWTADAVWETAERDFVGRDVVAKVFTKARGRYALALQQVLSGLVEERGPDDPPGALRATWQIREVQRTHDGEGVELYGTYRDVCVEGGDGWQFARRRFDPLYRGPIALPGTVLDGEQP
jgi:hypothetical protein